MHMQMTVTVELLVIARRYFKVLLTVFSTNEEAKSSTDTESLESATEVWGKKGV